VVQDILDGIPDIHFSRLNSSDVVRHKLVGKIVDAYERYDAKGSRPGSPPRPAAEGQQGQQGQRRGTRR
jgi:phosphate starvation-inducible PhoH-like protein